MSEQDYKNYLRPQMRPEPVYKPWTSAVIGCVLGYVLRLVLGFVLGFLGLIAAVGFGTAGGGPPDSGTVLIWVIAGYLFVIAVAALPVSAFLRKRGAHRPILAALVAGFAAFFVELGAQQVDPTLGFVLPIVAEISALVLLTQHPQRLAQQP